MAGDGADREVGAGPERNGSGGGEPVMDEPIAKKAYYSIGEVCDLTGLKPHVLRYWESQFDALHPSKNSAGNRVYRPKEIELILLVKRLLYEEKYTIDGANQQIQEMRGSDELEEERRQIAEPEFLQAIKSDLKELARLLQPPTPEESRGD